MSASLLTSRFSSVLRSNGGFRNAATTAALSLTPNHISNANKYNINNNSLLKQSSRAYRAPINDARFLINEVFDYPKHYKTAIKNEDATPEMLDSILEECAKFCQDVIGPLNTVADTEGSQLIGLNKVKTPKGFKEAYDLYCEQGWQGLSFPQEFGGQGLPTSFGLFRSEMIGTANFTWGMFPGLTLGFMNTLLFCASEELKKKYLPPLVNGQWTGTMCLTEPQCGSDLAQVKTKALPNGDGTYSITGTKIFISCGEHDLTENILHCVLARLPGAPEGTKGISLFLVPKYKVLNDDLELGEHNKVNIGRIENKMGCHGSPTCEINFEGAEGFLIGTENRGLNHMFTFINTSRIGTAIQGLGAAELSFQKSYDYALERGSMRSLTGVKKPSAPADPIIVHPDVRRMLLTQKAVAEGGRAMIYECAKLGDIFNEAVLKGDKKLEQKVDDRLGFLTPILKGFLTEKGHEAANMGIQIWGGHGYIQDNGVEQIVRDCRIACCWEGTTGIQGLDLLGRKVMLQKLRPLQQNVNEIYSYCWKVSTSGNGLALAPYIKALLKNTAKWQMQSYKIAATAMKDKDIIGSASVDYLMYGGYNTMAYMWLRMAEAALIAKSKPASETTVGDHAFYDAKLETANFFFKRILPCADAHYNGMTASTSSVMKMSESNFNKAYQV